MAGGSSKNTTKVSSFTALLREAKASTLERTLEVEYHSLESELRGGRIPRKRIRDHAISALLVDQCGNEPSTQTVYRTLRRIANRQKAAKTKFVITRVPLIGGGAPSTFRATHPPTSPATPTSDGARLRALMADAKARTDAGTLFGQLRFRSERGNEHREADATAGTSETFESPSLERHPVSDGKPPTRR